MHTSLWGPRMNEKREEVGIRREILGAALPWFAASGSGLWPLTALVMWLNEEIPGAELELKQTEILSGFCHLFRTCH